MTAMSARSLLIAGCLAVSMPALADQLNIKPGLWEFVGKTHVAGGPPIPKEMLEKMTPEQRAQAESAMTAEADKDSETEIERECITQEDIENLFHDEAEGCTHTVVSATRTTQELRLTCTGETRGSGVLRITTPTPESLRGMLDLKMDHDSGVMTIKGEYTGRWLGADCGDEGESDDDAAD
jgi:hypothetical protein